MTTWKSHDHELPPHEEYENREGETVVCINSVDVLIRDKYDQCHVASYYFDREKWVIGDIMSNHSYSWKINEIKSWCYIPPFDGEKNDN